MLTAIQASFATTYRARMAVITLPAPFTVQARIIIGLKWDSVRRHAGQTGLAENPPFGSDARLAIDPGRANGAHEAVWVVAFEVSRHVAEGTACSAGSSYPYFVEFGTQDPFARCYHLVHFLH